MSITKFDPTSLIPGILTAIKGVAVTREILGQSLQELGEEISRGEHIPDDALARAQSDQQLLNKLFNR